MPLLYEGMDPQSADEIAALDSEIQSIKSAILDRYPSINLDQVMPIEKRLCSMYDGQIGDKSNLKRIFNTNQGYKNLPFPMVPVEGQDLKKTAPGDVKVILNKNARFFWEDLPYGLVILKDIGDIVGVPTPNVVRNIIFHQQYMPIKYVDESTGELIPEVVTRETGAPSAYGITTIEQLVRTSMTSDGTEEATQKYCCENMFFNKRARL